MVRSHHRETYSVNLSCLLLRCLSFNIIKLITEIMKPTLICYLAVVKQAAAELRIVLSYLLL